MQVLDQWTAARLANRAAHLRWLAADVSLDLVQLRNTCQRLGREW